MIFEQKIIATIVLMFGASAMIAARRFRNDDTAAGTGIAGWTVVILIIGIWWN